jgi:hypothetical protein
VCGGKEEKGAMRRRRNKEGTRKAKRRGKGSGAGEGTRNGTRKIIQEGREKG